MLNVQELGELDSVMANAGEPLEQLDEIQVDHIKAEHSHFTRSGRRTIFRGVRSGRLLGVFLE